jgi:hypothetical protein
VNVLPLILLLGLPLSGTPPAVASPAEEPPEAGAPRDWNQPPPGSPEDVALWTRLRDAQNGSVIQMGRIAQASFRIRYSRYYERLDEASRSSPGPRAEEARRLRSRIEVAATQADQGIPKTGLKVRVCKYTLLHLDQRMSYPDDKAMAADMPKFRAEARSCADELAPFEAKMRPLAEALDAALTDAEAFLDVEPEATKPGPAGPSPAPPGAAPAVPVPGARP